jgi:hypothetical protein
VIVCLIITIGLALLPSVVHAKEVRNVYTTMGLALDKLGKYTEAACLHVQIHYASIAYLCKWYKYRLKKLKKSFCTGEKQVYS